MTQNSVLFRTPGEEPAMEPWAVGCFAAGFPATILDSRSTERPAAAVVAVCGGSRRHGGNNLDILDHYSEAGIPVFMIESSPLSRHQLLFMGSKRWLPPAPPSAITRRVSQGLVCWPQPRGHKVLVLGQGEAFDSVLEPHLEKLSSETLRPIMYRRHPNDRSGYLPAGCDSEMESASLEDDLVHTWAVITHSSGAARDALLRGIPVFCHEEAQFKWVASPLHQLWRIEDQEAAPVAAVHRFMDRFSCIQWEEKEIRSGEAFNFFRPFW